MISKCKNNENFRVNRFLERYSPKKIEIENRFFVSFNKANII